MTHPANLAAAAASKSAIGSLGACPLRQTHVQLLPLAYGLVEKTRDPSAELTLPYSLTSRPLGIRLLRDGWLYIIDNLSGELYEYRMLNGSVDAFLHRGKTVTEDQRAAFEARPALVFSRKATLHVSFAEVQWTAAKCGQVLESLEDRGYFMQAVDLGPVNCLTGGTHLLTVEQAKRWLAELPPGAPAPEAALMPAVQVSDAPAHEREPYLWEQQARFREAHIGELLGRVRGPYQDDTLFLVVQDDLGVLRDLAQYQDQVVRWVDTWKDTEHNERDYLLACYIESLSELSIKDLEELDKTEQDPAINALFADLEQLPEPQRAQTREALRAYLNQGGKVAPADVSPSPQLEQLRREAVDKAYELNRFDGVAPDASAYGRASDEADRVYYTREHFQMAPDDFVERHVQTLVELGKTHDRRVLDLLDGSLFSGKRGINDLIDRPAMDETLWRHRDDLSRWNRMLERITADRTHLVTAGRYHRAAWYYDSHDPQQLGQTFTAEYACLMDICRSDWASEALLGYLEQHPELTRPLFYTLPLRLRPELIAQYSTLSNAGMALLTHLPQWLDTLRRIERPHLPALDDLPDHTRAVADAAQHTLSPALNLGLSRALEGFDLSGDKLPDLEQLFRQLPKALPARLLDAAKTTGATFTVASPAEHEALNWKIKYVLSERAYLTDLNRQRNRLTHNKNRQGHMTPRAVELQNEIVRVRGVLAEYEGQLAAALSPIAELPDQSARLYGATPARAGLTVLFPPAQQYEVRRLLSNIRLGIQEVPTAGLVKSEGMGLLVVLVQIINLADAVRDLKSQSRNERIWMPVLDAAITMGAAGFTAAQSLADTSLRASSDRLVAGLQHHALQSVHVQMGKLHVGLGLFTYGFGLASSIPSFQTQQKNWQQATRSGNHAGRNSAALASTGAAGMTTVNSYGLGHTVHAGYSVLMAKNSAARTAAWAAAGTRLSTVFFRFNLAGALFTVLELGGTWLFNRYNLSAHGQWLKTTPWSRDSAERGDHSLETYCRDLADLIDAPYAQLGPNAHDSWLKNLLLKAKPSDIHLVLPRRSLKDFQPPLSGQPRMRLGIGAHRISVPLHHRGVPRERKTVISNEIVNSLRIVESDTDKLVLCLCYPPDPDNEFSPATETLELVVCLQTLNDKGAWVSRNQVIRLDPRGQGHYPISPRDTVPELPLMFRVETHLLELADHAHQP